MKDGFGLVDISKLDRVIQKTKKIVEKSREELYQLGEAARHEYEHTKQELAEIIEKIKDTIQEVDKLEEEYYQARIHLIEVSRNFNKYGEDEIKEAYDYAHKKQIELLEKREKEKIMRLHRDYLERTLKNLEITIKRSEQLITNIGMALKILCNDLETASAQIG